MVLKGILGLKGLALAACAISTLRTGALAKGVLLGGAGATLTAVGVLAAVAAARGCRRGSTDARATSPAPGTA
jgi:hypothetical protein